MKIGDKVKFNETGYSSMTLGKEYIVLGLGSAAITGKDLITVESDAGHRLEFYTERFEIVVGTDSIDAQVSKAKEFIGKRCDFTASLCGTVKTFTPIKIEVFVDKKSASESSSRVLTHFNKYGNCVALVGNGNAIELQGVTLASKSVEISLTKDYKAEISANEVKVGCQTISRAKIEEILKHMNELK